MKNLLLLIFLICAYYQMGQAQTLPSTSLIAETRKKIVVVDTHLRKNLFSRDYICKTKLGQPETYNASRAPLQVFRPDHGSNVVGIIGDRIDKTKYCIVPISWMLSDGDEYFKLLKIAEKVENIVALNLSISSTAKLGENPYDLREHASITALLLKGVDVIVAGGNDGRLLTEKSCLVYPACLKNYYNAVGLKNFFVVTTKTLKSSNKSTIFKMEERVGNFIGTPRLSGTSQATAVFTGERFSK